jgi:hypothetical protein
VLSMQKALPLVYNHVQPYFCYSIDSELEIDRTSSPDLCDTARDDELEAIASSSSISSASVKVEPLSDLESKETTRYIHLNQTLNT